MKKSILIACPDASKIRHIRKLIARINQAAKNTGATKYTVSFEAKSGWSASRMIERHRPDISIISTDLSGMAMAQGVESSLTNIILVSENPQEAVGAVSSSAKSFVVLPATIPLLYKALDNCGDQSCKEPESRSQKTRTHIAITSRGATTLIPIEDIIYFEACHKYVSVHHLGGESITEESLTSLEATISGELILRIHRARLVNKRFIKEVNTKGKYPILKLNNTSNGLRISQRHLSNVRRLINSLSGI